MSMKNFYETIGNRTHHLLACSVMSQPTEPYGVKPKTIPYKTGALVLNNQNVLLLFNSELHIPSLFIVFKVPEQEQVAITLQNISGIRRSIRNTESFHYRSAEHDSIIA